MPPSAFRLHAILPLSLLETLQALDAPQRDDPEELRREMASKRLGASETITKQVARYRRLAREGGLVHLDDVASLLVLCSRRADGALLYSNAGRLAAAYAVPRGPGPLGRVLPRGAADALGIRAVRRVGRDVFGLAVTRSGSGISAVPGFPRDSATWVGRPCILFGSGLGALLRTFVGFEGAVLHERCIAQGADTCVWSTDP